MGIDVNFDWGVHANNSQSANNLGRVRYLLRAQEKLRMIVFPAVVEALEPFRGKSDGGRSSEVKPTTVKEVKECILQDLCPDFEVLEVCLSTRKPADDSVCDVADARLDWKQVDGKSSMVNFMLKKLDQVAGNCPRCFVLRCIGSCLIWL